MAVARPIPRSGHTQVYPWCDEYIAHMVGVKGAVRAHAQAAAARASANLAAHRHAGHSRITTQRGITDVLVTLDDDRGQRAALSIEYGRNAYVTADGREVGAMEGLRVLRGAFGV